jgi:hypothetical protein
LLSPALSEALFGWRWGIESDSFGTPNDRQGFFPILLRFLKGEDERGELTVWKGGG